MNKLHACLGYIRFSEKYECYIDFQSFRYLKIAFLTFILLLLLLQYANFLWFVNGFSEIPQVLRCSRTFDCCFFRCQILWKKNILNPQTQNTNPILYITKDFLLMKNTLCSEHIIYILHFFPKDNQINEYLTIFKRIKIKMIYCHNRIMRLCNSFFGTKFRFQFQKK